MKRILAALIAVMLLLAVVPATSLAEKAASNGDVKVYHVQTNGGNLNLRRGPGSGYGQVGSMDNGTTLNVYAYKNGWALVKHNGTWGWCSVDYLK